ncbi:DUF3806 domain-containing protein [Marinimicrobium agarilyticum]|uniref:DUF3806 domain-containing protein n=1 Tax=Marinimicrobium agarilyticum TaxID=306546 RepID=UPI000425B6DB|nr:DUF3806 domain-containing protein [Marinimicrobium agarilyticum]
MNPKALLSLGLLVSLFASFAQAQEATVSDFAWMDRNHMAQQIESIEKITRIKFGTPIRENKSDLDTLQRIIDRDLIDRSDQLKLQALGAVLGNVMANEVDELEWKVYEDKLGRSRALCIEGTRQCLFPITMLSRRMEVGLKPNVERVYNEAMELVEPYLPEVPYGAP